MPKLLNIYQHTKFLSFFYNFELWYCFCANKHMHGRSILVKIQQKSKTCKVRNASCRFWKIYNFQIFGQSTDRTGRGREVDPLVGFPWNTQIFGIFSTHIHHTNMSKMFWRFIRQTCLRRLFQCQYFSRPLFEIFEQEWIPWFELHVVEKSTHWPWVTQGGGRWQYSVMSCETVGSPRNAVMRVTTCGDQNGPYLWHVSNHSHLWDGPLW